LTELLLFVAVSFVSEVSVVSVVAPVIALSA